MKWYGRYAREDVGMSVDLSSPRRRGPRYNARACAGKLFVWIPASRLGEASGVARVAGMTTKILSLGPRLRGDDNLFLTTESDAPCSL